MQHTLIWCKLEVNLLQHESGILMHFIAYKFPSVRYNSCIYPFRQTFTDCWQLLDTVTIHFVMDKHGVQFGDQSLVKELIIPVLGYLLHPLSPVFRGQSRF